MAESSDFLQKKLQINPLPQQRPQQLHLSIYRTEVAALAQGPSLGISLPAKLRALIAVCFAHQQTKIHHQSPACPGVTIPLLSRQFCLYYNKSSLSHPINNFHLEVAAPYAHSILLHCNAILQPTTSAPARMQWVVDLLVSKQTTVQAKPVGPKASKRSFFHPVRWIGICYI